MICQTIVTQPVDDIMDFTNFIEENQVGVALNDTEELHSPCCSESSEVALLDGYDTEVVPDSDDDTTEPIFSKRSSLGIACFIKRFVGDLDKVESPSHSPCEKPESSNNSIGVCDDRGHFSNQTAHMNVLQGNDGCPVHCSMKVSVSDREMPKTLDPLLASTIDNSDKLETKVDDCGRISKPKQTNVSIVYTRKRKRTGNFEANDVEDEKRSSKKTNGDSGLSYVESQEPEDVSNALLFVDQYVVLNAVLSSPVADFTVKDKSLSAQSANGACNLIRSVHRRNREEEKHIFEWDDRQDGSELSDASGKKFNQTYIRRFSSVGNMISKDTRNLGDLWKEKTDDPNDLTQKDATMVVNKCSNARVIEQMCEKEDWRNSEMPGQQVNAECMVEEGKNYRKPEYAYDVGVDTQMAAEAIQALAYATSVDCSEVDGDKCQHDMLNKSFNGSQQRIIAGNWSFPKKGRSASKDAMTRSEESGDRLKSTLASISKAKRSSKKFGAGGCIDGWSPDVSTRVDFMHKKRVNGAKVVKMDGAKENLRPFLSIQHSSVHKVKCKKKGSIMHPVAGPFKSSNVFGTKEGPTTESVDAKPDVKVDSCDKRKRRSIVNASDMSDQMGNRSEAFNEKCMHTNDATMSEEGLIYQGVDDTGVHKSVDVKINQKEIVFDADDKGRDKMLRASGSLQNLSKLLSRKSNDARNTRIGHQKASYVPGRPANWYSRDYPKGKRCKIILGQTGGSLDFGYSSVRVSSKHNSHHSRDQLDLEGFISPSSTGSNIKKKRRSSIYVSPCWLLSQNSGRSSVRNDDHKLREIGIVYDNDSSYSNTTDSEHQIGSSNALQPGKTDNKSCVSTMDEWIRNNDPTLESNKDAITGDAGLPSNLIYKRNPHHGKKASTSSLTRELVRLGFRESMPEFSFNNSRKRKTMANIRVLLSKHLDERTQKQLKKILIRLGVSMASCPSNATHFIADKFARTRNMLEFVAQGKPVVTHMWLENCQQAGFYIDETSYILRDIKREQELGFRLSFSLDRARKYPLLKGYRVIITPNTKPGQEMLTSLVKAVHGQVVDLPTDHLMIEKMDLDYLFVVSCEEDQAYCLPFLERGAPTYSSELLLNGIIVQKLEFERHRLFMEA